MPWCPVCKNEYRAGFTTCTECKVDLVESLEDVPVAIYFGSEKELTSIVNFLKSNDFQDVALKFDEKDGQYELLVKKEQEKAAKHMIQIFYRELQGNRIELEDILKDDDDDKDSDLSDEIELASEEMLHLTEYKVESESVLDLQGDIQAEEMQLVYSHGADEEVMRMSDMERMQKEAMKLKNLEKEEVFKDQHNRADDYKSSGQALLFVGILCIVFLAINVMGILPFQLAGIAQCVMLAMCIFFIVFGCYSMKESKKIEEQADDDDTVIEQMLTFLKEQVTKEKLDEIINNTDALEEQLYFARTEFIKEELKKQFGEKYQPIIDKITDDYYEELYS